MTKPLLAFVLCLLSTAAQAQAPPQGRELFGTGWKKVPSVVVLGAQDDPRVVLVRDAVEFWNTTFAKLGTPFRLGEVRRGEGPVPSGELAALSERVVGRSGPAPFPEFVRNAPGDMVVALATLDFVSFAIGRQAEGKALVAIKDHRMRPLSLPNVARNVIAHEMGHALGLGHNDDSTTLMCGRPARCRPDAFMSSTEHYFPLTARERELLLFLYPADWKSHAE